MISFVYWVISNGGGYKKFTARQADVGMNGVTRLSGVRAGVKKSQSREERNVRNVAT